MYHAMTFLFSMDFRRMKTLALFSIYSCQEHLLYLFFYKKIAKNIISGCYSSQNYIFCDSLSAIFPAIRNIIPIFFSASDDQATQ